MPSIVSNLMPRNIRRCDGPSSFSNARGTTRSAQTLFAKQLGSEEEIGEWVRKKGEQKEERESEEGREGDSE